MKVSQIKIDNPLRALPALGQSIWLDDLRRGAVTSGALRRLIQEDGLSGVTSNPSIFEQAITGSSDYDQALHILTREAGLDAKARYERLAVEDAQSVADLLQPIYARTKRRDGYVSLDVSPHLAHDTRGMLDEAKRLWDAVGRDNVMITIPATPEGIPAIVQLIGKGINVNVTWIFAQDIYESVAEAYLIGLEQRSIRGGDLTSVASVASLFISRIDTEVDAWAAAALRTAPDETTTALLRGLQGTVAIANAKLAYQRYRTLFSSPRWQALARRGAMTQRLLWADTTTTNPPSRDVQYLEELIGPDTVATMAPATLEAFRDHGRPAGRLATHIDGAREVLRAMDQAGLSMTAITDRLLADGLQSFRSAFDRLLVAIDRHGKGTYPGRLNRWSYRLPAAVAADVHTSLKEWSNANKVRRLWERDASLWTDGDEHQWLGWLDITDQQLAHLSPLTSLAEEVSRRGFTHALLLGMGGSSLCAEVLRTTFGKQAGYPELHVLDSTDPAQIRAVEKKLQLATTLILVSSKSGNTMESMLLKQHFFDRLQRLVGARAAVRQFVAITDPGSDLQRLAEADGFGRLYFGVPTIGGRYSALSNFGMVPAAVMGLDLEQFLEGAEEMVEACFPCVPVEQNPGLVLGTILAVFADRGCNKVTILTSPELDSLGIWLEQLLAESTGKTGKGIIPIEGEAVGDPKMYGEDRLFLSIRLQTSPDPIHDAAVDRLERAGHPVVRMTVADLYEIGQEFFRWEFATAVAGAILGVNPFDQPDVEAGKAATKRLTTEYERSGRVPAETPIFEERGLSLYATPQYARELRAAAGTTPSLQAYLKAHLNQLKPGDYVALLAYLEMRPQYKAELQAMRQRIRDAKRIATCLEFGPRFLHSTGQAYKGGPHNGLFLQLTCEDAVDLSVPGQRYTFGLVKAMQARGDFHVLTERGRRLLRIHLDLDVQAGLATLKSAIEQALA
ncbi:MAG: bifunctional transaldolase/phosoglucose isomerase [Nitrospira sp. NTP2]|nr:bifunctional transaldolase/phosoglucose isomerase [Nitrospira sp. NTP2]QOJ37191.1 MAG: bifunctional transaldolase/phosoglucose isomerase [Nitrospira sp.]RIK61451.1 MAG: transaldolase [Nitrospira sp.]